MKLTSSSLFGRTAITIALTLLLFTVVSMVAVVYFIMYPMAKRSADDFAAELVSAAHALQDLPEERHEELKQELLLDHGLVVSDVVPRDDKESVNTPYLMLFRESLNRLAGEELMIIGDEPGPLIWVGFDRERLGTNPPLAFAAIVGGGAALTILVALLEVRRVVNPLDRLSRAVRDVGLGQKPAPVEESGPEEIAELAHIINRLSADINEMAENRTVMIAGISHDLRTPLTRLAIAVEMLDQESRPELIAGIRRDLDAMNDLISQFLEFTRDADEGSLIQVDLWKIIEALAGDLEREGAELRLQRNDPPCVFFADAVALQRVLANLLKNAAQYGRGKPIDIALHCSADEVAIEVCDRGPGIPPEKVDSAFRPFQRLEPAREHRTGGSGLGLSIVKVIAMKHNWTIDLLPREGGGTIARLGLPTACRFALNRAAAA